MISSATAAADPHGPRRGITLTRSDKIILVLCVVGVAAAGLTRYVHTPAAKHEGALSVAVAVVLLLIFVLSLPASLKRDAGAADHTSEPPRWPLWFAVLTLVLASGAAALVSDWFVTALEPAIGAL